MIIEKSYYTNIGNRSVNEDTVHIAESEGSSLAMVADGLGGHGDGDKASQCAANVLSEELKNSEFSEDSVFDAVNFANACVHNMQTAGKKMKTTIAAVWIKGNSAIAANVGDTRIYHIRNREIIFQSVDHSVAQIAVFIGEMKASEIRSSDKRNRLTRALGADETVKVDSTEFTVEKDDFLLICSDGFWDIITEEKMLECLDDGDSAEQWLSKMREYVSANATSSMDNNSAIVLKIAG